MRATWFAKPGDDTSEAATETWGRAGPWQPRIREECEAVRDGVERSAHRARGVVVGVGLAGLVDVLPAEMGDGAGELAITALAPERIERAIGGGPERVIDLLAITFVVARVGYVFCYLADWASLRSAVCYLVMTPQ